MWMIPAMRRLANLLMAASLTGASALATPLYWDGNGDGTLGDTGTWSTSGHNGTTGGQWSTSSTTPANPGPYGDWDQAGGQDIADIQFTIINQTVTISGTVNANQVNITSPNVQNPNDIITGGTLNLTGAATINMKFFVDGVNQWIDINSPITGSNGLTTSGKGQIALGGNNSYTGTTTLNNGRVVDLTASTAIPAASILNLQSVTTRIRSGVSATAAGLTGGGSLQFQGSGTTGGITLSRNDGGTSTYTGSLFLTNGTTQRHLTKAGNYTQVLGGTGANTMKSVDVQGGTLALAKTAGVDAIGATIVVPITLSGGELRLDAANQINNAATMSLAGGTFNANGFSETLGALTLASGASFIDFGSGTSTLNFASGAWTAGTLTVSNWSGSVAMGGGTDQFRLLAMPAANFLSSVNFTGYEPGARVFNYGTYVEVLPTPEPATVALLALGALALVRRQRRAGDGSRQAVAR